MPYLEIRESRSAAVLDRGRDGRFRQSPPPGCASGLDWRTLVAGGDWRPRTEDDFREFVATPLLREVAGSVDGILAECRTMRRCRWTGFVDNLVRIDEIWTAVECKLRIPSEAAMVRQAGQYIGCTKAMATLGAAKGSQLQLARSQTCWVLDSFGLYLLDRNGFVDCGLDAPPQSLSELASMPGTEIGGLPSGAGRSG